MNTKLNTVAHEDGHQKTWILILPVQLIYLRLHLTICTKRGWMRIRPSGHPFLYQIRNSRHWLYKVRAKPWLPKETGNKHLPTKNQTADYFSSFSNNSNRKRKKKKSEMLEKEPVMLTENPNLLLTVSEQDIFLSKVSWDKRFTDGWWQFTLPCHSVQNVLN